VGKAAAALGSAIWFCLAPALISGVVPWLLTDWQVGRTCLPLQAFGVLLVTAGTTALLDGFTRFVKEGEGTPAPVAPPSRLVVSGLYRFVRNPMYLAVVLVIIGQALILGRPGLWVYAGATWLITVAFVRWIEEPTLHAQFGADYETYRRAVPAWVPRRRPWRAEELSSR
jgi:protein-S-isoprenylcysteine O-methyltransferase Ste14